MDAGACASPVMSTRIRVPPATGDAVAEGKTDLFRRRVEAVNSGAHVSRVLPVHAVRPGCCCTMMIHGTAAVSALGALSAISGRQTSYCKHTCVLLPRVSARVQFGESSSICSLPTRFPNVYEVSFTGSEQLTKAGTRDNIMISQTWSRSRSPEQTVGRRSSSQMLTSWRVRCMPRSRD
ncbi:hypothetical protein K466DRAFT_337666 [Polyporus arcularius HHB13444]|uniref:Uncharacterized protein n=1 Tax=Polyporus arcularius HHB13444 TaxID=1314778 RepID=A0A5C3PQ05_9APHY|nr:hypothetical protein K466DRAFT_337666 [Polyporus arcularius HHB13444]